jgi:hypothetical protein
MREEVAHEIWSVFGDGNAESPNDYLELADDWIAFFGKLFREEIEGMENPYMPIRAGTDDADRVNTFESCRQAILEKLR